MVAKMETIGLVPEQQYYDPPNINFLDREIIRLAPKTGDSQRGLHLRREK